MPELEVTSSRSLRARLDATLAKPLPEPPGALRVGPFRAETRWPGPHDARTAALLGRALGICITVCFITGFISHLHQHPPAWLDLPSRPVWGYQFTQGLHIATGIATVPLLLAKLMTVFPKLFSWPPAGSIGQALERLLIVPLVAGTLFQLASGLLNIVQWYPWHFYFPLVHWSMAWVVLGSMLVHLAIKAPVIRTALQRAAAPPGQSTPDRRSLLIGTGAAVGALTLATAGQTFRPLAAVSLLAPRDPRVGPQGVPINRTAQAAGVTHTAIDPQWRLTVAAAGGRDVVLSMSDLLAMPQHESVLPIACVEGWSVTARWSGVRLRDLLVLAGVDEGAHVVVRSLEQNASYSESDVGPSVARDSLTLLALRLNGSTLTVDHGFPVRLIAPNRPGVMQTKWLSRIEVRA